MEASCSRVVFAKDIRVRERRERQSPISKEQAGVLQESWHIESFSIDRRQLGLHVSVQEIPQEM